MPQGQSTKCPLNVHACQDMAVHEAQCAESGGESTGELHLIGGASLSPEVNFATEAGDGRGICASADLSGSMNDVEVADSPAVAAAPWGFEQSTDAFSSVRCEEEVAHEFGQEVLLSENPQHGCFEASGSPPLAVDPSGGAEGTCVGTQDESNARIGGDSQYLPKLISPLDLFVCPSRATEYGEEAHRLSSVCQGLACSLTPVETTSELQGEAAEAAAAAHMALLQLEATGSKNSSSSSSDSESDSDIVSGAGSASLPCCRIGLGAQRDGRRSPSELADTSLRASGGEGGSSLPQADTSKWSQLGTWLRTASTAFGFKSGQSFKGSSQSNPLEAVTANAEGGREGGEKTEGEKIDMSLAQSSGASEQDRKAPAYSPGAAGVHPADEEAAPRPGMAVLSPLTASVASFWRRVGTPLFVSSLRSTTPHGEGGMLTEGQYTEALLLEQQMLAAKASELFEATQAVDIVNTSSHGSGENSSTGECKEVVGDLKEDSGQSGWQALITTLSHSSRRPAAVVEQATNLAISAARAADRAFDALVAPVFSACKFPSEHGVDSGENWSEEQLPETAESPELRGTAGAAAEAGQLVRQSTRRQLQEMLATVQQRQQEISEELKRRSINVLEHSVALTTSSSISEARYHLAEIADTGGPEVSAYGVLEKLCS